LCVKEGIQSKTEIKEKEQRELLAYQSKHANVSLSPNAGTDVMMDGSKQEWQQDRPVVAVKNPEGITRLFIKNLHSDTDEARLVELLDQKVTHIQWLTDRQTGQFYGTAFCEMASKDDAAHAVANLHKQTVNGRTIVVKLQKANSKDIWPTKQSAISLDAYDTSYNESS
jgi:nucleolin